MCCMCHAIFLNGPAIQLAGAGARLWAWTIRDTSGSVQGITGDDSVAARMKALPPDTAAILPVRGGLFVMELGHLSSLHNSLWAGCGARRMRC